jgi:hypothetical protein
VPRSDTQFGPGNRANPSGRPKVAEEFRAKCRRAVDAKCIAAWINEIETMGDEWVRCSELLASYGYGKPTQHLEHSAEGGGSLGIEVVFVGAKSRQE